MSAIIADALATHAAMRDEFELYRHALYTRAMDECRGELLSRRGQVAGIDPYSLFIGPEARARAYASAELLEWWKANGRPTLTAFEAHWWAQREGWLG